MKKIADIRNVIVDRISLVSKGEKPAVEKAETRFSIFKIWSPKKLITKDIENKLESIKKTLEK